MRFKFRIASRLRDMAEWLEKERRFHWPRWAPWRRRVMMRWAVKEHRRTHNDQFVGCELRLMTRRTMRLMRRMMDERATLLSEAMTNAGNKAVFQRLTYRHETEREL